ncbi:ankyrin repeat and SAM domain-containing protein 3-like [Anneissia japonica]|uniref:ankyrin repeat and SAM domain-containing protein 3-like n=1 Tax=Anneissia japonica TaxID=1529436 RepID=UPI0014257388|nr:ankyrin repeat and SAM domain-containing protein 3-like [Anneissia japonica]
MSSYPATGNIDYPYEASDEASETELLDRSLSVWRGYDSLQDQFNPIPLDLYTACSIGHYETVHAFIQSGQVDLNQKNKGSWTPLMYASYISHDNIVNLLLDGGVQVDIKTDKGATAFMLAASCGNESVCYFLLQQGAKIDERDMKGWTALFYATNAGHQTMVQFLLDSGSQANVVDFLLGITPLMMASAEGHEIIVNKLLEHGVDIEYKNSKGDTARSLAIVNGHMKIVSLIDNRTMASVSLRSEPGLGSDADLSSSDENYQRPNRHHGRTPKLKSKGPSIRDGPEAVAKMLLESRQTDCVRTTSKNSMIPSGYVTFEDNLPFITDPVSNREVISPINPMEHDIAVCDGNEKGSSWFEQYEQGADGDLTIKRSNSSSLSGSNGGLAGSVGISRENSLSSNDEDDKLSKPDAHKPHKHTTDGNSKQVAKNESVEKWFNQNVNQASHHLPPLYGHIPPEKVVNIFKDDVEEPYPYTNLATLLESLNLSKYHSLFEEQDVDLRVFLTLNDTDLKEIGIKLLGPRKKMTNAIARKHSKVRPFNDSLEQTYADRVESIMQEMAQKYQQLSLANSKLDAQVQEERELRSVAESCLMEDRKTWQYVQDLIVETCKMSHNIRLCYDHIRTYQTELLKRFQSNNTEHASSGSGVRTNTSAINSTEENENRNQKREAQFALPTNIPSEQDLSEVTLENLITNLNHYMYQMGRSVAMATNNMDKLSDGHQLVFSPNSSGNSLP